MRQTPRAATSPARLQSAVAVVAPAVAGAVAARHWAEFADPLRADAAGCLFPGCCTDSAAFDPYLYNTRMENAELKLNDILML